MLGKRRRLQEKTLRMDTGYCYLPKQNESRPKGDDAYFICKRKQTIGVADGGGGGASRGVNAGEYARQLMLNSDIALNNQPAGKAVKPLEVLQEAHLNTRVDGSSTACVVTLEGNRLKFVNLGDSGFMLFRDKKLVYRTPAQQYDFNKPYQTGKDDKDLKELSLEGEVKVEAGDVVVVGTDGLFDNLFPHEIEHTLMEINWNFWPEDLACSLAVAASDNSLNLEYICPYRVKEAVSRDCKTVQPGGKYDDITVLVGVIEPRRRC